MEARNKGHEFRDRKIRSIASPPLDPLDPIALSSLSAHLTSLAPDSSWYDSPPVLGSDILADIHSLYTKFSGPPPRWMVRAANLTDDQNQRLDSLGLPERQSPTTFLPRGCIALVFEGHGDTDPNLKIMMIREEC